MSDLVSNGYLKDKNGNVMEIVDKAARDGVERLTEEIEALKGGESEFTQSGRFVFCEPANDSTLNVTAAEATKVWRGGRNLVDVPNANIPTNSSGGSDINFYGGRGNSLVAQINALPRNATYFFSFEDNGDGADAVATGLARVQYTDGTKSEYIDPPAGKGFHFEDGKTVSTVTLYGHTNNTAGGIFNLQIEFGEQQHEYEEYRGEWVDASAGYCEIAAIDGLNVLFADAGDIVVNGIVYSEQDDNYEELDKRVTALEAQKLETPKVVITDKLYAVAGHEFVLYYNNILRCMCPENYVVSTVFNDDTSLLALNPQYDRMLKFTPTSEHVGTYSITIKVVDKRTWETVATKDSCIVISADTALDGKRVMFIGDSLTEASTYVAEIERMSNNGIVSVGTIQKSITFNGGTATVKSEGRSGWASYDYLYNRKTNFTNPFYNPDIEHSITLDKKYNLSDFGFTLDNSGDKSVLKHHFDFAYYMQNNPDVEVPDAVFINLGTNGGNGYALSYVYIGFDAMIERIRAYSATLPIYLYLFPPTSKRESGGSSANGTRNVNIKYDARTGYYDCIQTLIDRYKDDDRVIIVPTYTMLDTLYDYKVKSESVSARSTETVTLAQTDRTHPAVSGYLHMADSFYNVLQALWN